MWVSRTPTLYGILDSAGRTQCPRCSPALVWETVSLNERGMQHADPAHNLAREQAAGPWILAFDPDERVPEVLARDLQRIAGDDVVGCHQLSVPGNRFGLYWLTIDSIQLEILPPGDRRM